MPPRATRLFLPSSTLTQSSPKQALPQRLPGQVIQGGKQQLTPEDPEHVKTAQGIDT